MFMNQFFQTVRLETRKSCSDVIKHNLERPSKANWTRLTIYYIILFHLASTFNWLPGILNPQVISGSSTPIIFAFKKLVNSSPFLCVTLV